MNWQVGLGTAAMVLSILLTFQLRTEMKMKAVLPARQVNELAAKFNSQQLRLQKYQQENEYLHNQLQEYDRDREIINLKISAGLIPVRGKGILITLSQSVQQPKEPADPSFNVVYDYQLDLLMNELWLAGAEAIAVNEYRIINTTGFNHAGPIILVDAHKIAPPYQISVIGSPANLKSQLMKPGGFVDQEILPYGLKFAVETRSVIKVPAYKGKIAFEYGQPLPLKD